MAKKNSKTEFFKQELSKYKLYNFIMYNVTVED